MCTTNHATTMCVATMVDCKDLSIGTSMSATEFQQQRSLFTVAVVSSVTVVALFCV